MAADIELQFIADQLGKDLTKISPEVERELQKAVENLAHAAYAAMVSKVQNMALDPKNRQDYLKGLQFSSLGEGSWLIHLEGDAANRLEEGHGSYSIKDQLLKSDKIVEVGSRAGEKWVRKSKKGTKYAAVPFEKKPFSGEKSAGNLAEDMKRIYINNRAGGRQPITQIFKDLEGKPIHGKAAQAGQIESNPNLSNLTKYQYVHESGHVSSVYIVYRMVSENSPGWQHPGSKGYQLFKEAEEYVQDELKNILNTLV